MNLTQLARILKINPQELRDLLPQFGFDIGQRAIKIDNWTAQKIIKEWPRHMRELERKKLAEAQAKIEEEKKEGKEKIKITIPNLITVRDLADMANIPVSGVLKELMANGVFASMNERIDYETAAIVGANLGLEVILDESLGKENEKKAGSKLTEIMAKEDKKGLRVRPPVIVVMGHVDHGKTKLLDAIRKTDVVAGEYGGITQHIGAYQIERKNRLITFIDTPGHEAFTAMRSRGARVADIAILVVAADDGVKPQTVEAFRIIEAAKIPFIVAINKIDKEGADINKAKQELSSQLNITPEDWGGKTICAPISALKGEGVEELLDMVLLTSDLSEENVSANPKAQAAGTVVESHIDKGAGPMATILIQNGTLRVGDQLCFNNKIFGKVRTLKNYKGEDIKEAPPSTPAQILGLKILPEVGDILEVGEGQKVKTSQLKMKSRPEAKQAEDNDRKVKKLYLIIKADVLGSAEAIEESLEKINIKEVKSKIIFKGLGNITEGDIGKAEAGDAQILGFNVKILPQVQDLIREKEIKAKIFNVIYDLIEYVKEEMQTIFEPEIKRVDLGRLKVLAVFRTEGESQIVGGKVLEGKIEANANIEVFRDKKLIESGKLTKLQSGKEDVSEIGTDQECGLQYQGRPVIAEGDILHFYKEEKVIRKI
ncbi:translation initiation factor IF-2 [Candidatus Falkowbacteria bacterium CG11_big_fil_rev_8_21_14_0_20_39_10]|uniref:Translation initiation factor IF-2 n=1 Tax=Candidatus Falkowbacteria bacterium CG11_big_fil_rev_8_21_14_0_20_39_10 TaxID=1974570 RepID=A0A2M6K8G2_9BACT|nr:MAG: translation initiation factor IF-2 [Candidatus Falkowbacteria bacterium CG11_big_fil_rev_8_21_14_0_20_39_10]